MSTLTVPRPPVKPSRPRKPLSPVHVRAYFVGGASRQDVIDGAAVLSITDTDRGEEAPYWCEAIFDGDRCTGFRLRKFGGEETHDISRDLLTCTCGDATYRPERPGGCRHIASLRMALPTVAKDAPAAAPVNAA